MTDGYWRMQDHRQLTRDEEKAAVARGDFDLLVRSVIPLVIQITERLCKSRNYPDVDWAISCAFMALARSLRKYDPDQAKLTTWCYQPVYWEVLSEIDAFYTQKNSHIHHRCLSQFRKDSLPYQLFSLDSPVDAAGDRLDAAVLTKRLMKVLTPRQRKITKLRIKGMTFQEIGESLGCTRQGCEFAFAMGMKRMRAEVVKRGIQSPWAEVA